MLLVTRREGRQLARYAHLSTGNYNPRTARLYTDISYLTADPLMTADIDNVFVHLASQSRLPKLHHLLLAPFQLHHKLIAKIDALGEAALQGKDTRLVAKMNALTDEDLMLALVRAGRCGVKIDLIVRGACMGDARNLLMALAGDACIVIGGRAGTKSEVHLAWLHKRPLLPLVGCGGWSDELPSNPPDERENSPILPWSTVIELEANLRSLGLVKSAM